MGKSKYDSKLMRVELEPADALRYLERLKKDIEGDGNTMSIVSDGCAVEYTELPALVVSMPFCKYKSLDISPRKGFLLGPEMKADDATVIIPQGGQGTFTVNGIKLRVLSVKRIEGKGPIPDTLWHTPVCDFNLARCIVNDRIRREGGTIGNDTETENKGADTETKQPENGTEEKQ